MPYGLQLKTRGFLHRPTVGGGGPFINPRAPGARALMQFQPPMPIGPGMRSSIAAGTFPLRGDPGLFGAIGKFVGGVAKTVGKGVLGLAKNAVASTPIGGFVMGALSNTRIGAPASRTIASGGGTPIVMPPNPFSDFTGGGDVPVVVTGGGSGPGTAVALCAPAGYHLNKSGYWKSDSDLLPGASWHPKGTVLVKNRRTNPFNPRAASRAMARLGGLYRAMKVLDKQMAKVARGAGVQSRGSRGRGKGCGCTAPRRGK